MKVLYLTPPAAGGAALAAQTFVDEEIRAIRRAGVTPYVLSDDVGGRIAIDGIRLEGLAPPRAGTMLGPLRLAARSTRVTARLLRRALRPREVVHALRIEDAAARLVVRERIDVIHSHFGWPAGLGGSLAARSTGIPLVTSLRGTDVLVRADLGYGLRLDPLYDAALSHLFDTSATILVATRFMAAAAASAGAASSKITIVDKGVDTARFTRRASRAVLQQQLCVAGPLVVAVGGLQRRKGFETIIDALAALGRSDVTLICCGTGSHRGELEQRAERAGLAARIRFDGLVARDRIADYFAAADVFVHAAELEAAGNVVLEALACETPVIVTDSGGPAEYVEDGVNGFVIPVGDASALAARLGQLLADPSLGERLARCGRTRVEQRHSYARMMADLRGVYDDVTSSSRRRPRHDLAANPGAAVPVA